MILKQFTSKVLIMKVEGEIQTIRIVSAEKLFYGLL